jgi:hypothetical protein
MIDEYKAAVVRRAFPESLRARVIVARSRLPPNSIYASITR